MYRPGEPQNVFVWGWVGLSDEFVAKWWESVQDLPAPRGPNIQGWKFGPHLQQWYKRAPDYSGDL